jgi:hypothetical protein
VLPVNRNVVLALGGLSLLIFLAVLFKDLGGGAGVMAYNPLFWLIVGVLYVCIAVLATRAASWTDVGMWLLLGGVVLAVLGYFAYTYAALVGLFLALVGVLFLFHVRTLKAAS